MTPDLLCMILRYGTWYDILDMIYSSAAAYFIAIRSQFRMRRTYRKQREQGEAKREPERVRETKKEDRDKTRTAEEERNTATTHLSCTSLHGCVLLPLGVCASSVYVLAAAVRIIPYLWDAPALMCCCSPFCFFLFCCCCCYLLGLCSADGSLLL